MLKPFLDGDKVTFGGIQSLYKNNVKAKGDQIIFLRNRESNQSLKINYPRSRTTSKDPDYIVFEIAATIRSDTDLEEDPSST